jgi:hypothetical protein
VAGNRVAIDARAQLRRFNVTRPGKASNLSPQHGRQEGQPTGDVEFADMTDIPIWDQEPERLAHSMLQIFGRGAAGKALEMVRMQTKAGNRDGAVKWHRVMSLIEESVRKS